MIEDSKCHIENVAPDAISMKRSHIFYVFGNRLHLWREATAHFYKEAKKRMKHSELVWRK